MSTYRIVSLPGDGIGTEVITEGRRAADAAIAAVGRSIDWVEYDWSCETYRTTGRMMPEDGIDRVRDANAIYLGAVGSPGVPDHISLWGMLIPLRRELDLYANVRPVRLMPGVPSPLANRSPEEVDFVVVRENVEGEYSAIGGRMYDGTEHEAAYQQAVFTRRGCDRIMDYAFALAADRRAAGKGGKVTSATKSNGIVHTMPFWDERFEAARGRHPNAETDQFHIDILCARFVTNPDWFDVVVGSNLFGDILSDLGPAVSGSIGIAPSANIDPTGRNPSMFEPVHGSAPDIAGRGVANPIAAVWTASMMLDHLGEAEAAALIEGAMETVLAMPEGRTRDLGGRASTRSCGDAVVRAIEAA
ncbi:tartrate dehydrogenase [Pontivivens ytuae]|uniref:D-malate dehydrogenase [decarboxylating] n=1 Tax=Pontivivens ytuae TaxID=2789856 RepID=A0A7S9LRL4_9RHOB|nr:tartrate dehydrogenase [Pontivivens ytuae]QPH53968.1 tartrate dehydrogenase [Pontivivens ytuae]